MASADVETPAPAPGVPDYLLNPNAILGDDADWRLGHPPDYSGTRKVYQESKTKSHTPGSLEDMVENLVKNWEIEASHKMQLSDWRTIDQSNYSFAINGGPPQDAEHMLKVGTYNAIIAPSQFYDPKHIDFEESHDVFRNMMPNFAWEVLEVYSPPPVVAFKWRHWGPMKQDYVGKNEQGQTVKIKAHGGMLDIQGVTVAKLNDTLKVTKLETWFDPVEMFRQMKPDLKDAEVEVDGKKVGGKEAAEMLEHPTDSGVKALAEQVKGESHGQDIAELIEGTSLADQKDVHVLNPSAEGAEHSERRSSIVAAESSCPFISGQPRS